MANIFIVDDHNIPRVGLAALLEQDKDFTVCGQAGTNKEALALIRKTKPDLLITDISLEGESGLELIKDVLEFLPTLPVLVLTMYDESDYGDRAFRAGAKGYVPKNAGFAVLREAIQQLLQGERYLTPKMQDLILGRFFKKDEPKNDPIARLTNRELEVLRLLGQGMKTSDIALALGVSSKTVESHRENIKSKLSLKSSYELIPFAVRWRDQQEGRL